jgi:hypothetical protein
VDDEDGDFTGWFVRGISTSSQAPTRRPNGKKIARNVAATRTVPILAGLRATCL